MDRPCSVTVTPIAGHDLELRSAIGNRRAGSSPTPERDAAVFVVIVISFGRNKIPVSALMKVIRGSHCERQTSAGRTKLARRNRPFNTAERKVLDACSTPQSAPALQPPTAACVYRPLNSSTATNSAAYRSVVNAMFEGNGNQTKRDHADPRARSRAASPGAKRTTTSPSQL